MAERQRKRDTVQKLLTVLGYSKVRWRDPVMRVLGDDAPTKENVARIMREFEQA